MKINYFYIMLLSLISCGQAFASNCPNEIMDLNVIPNYHGHSVHHSSSPAKLERMKGGASEKNMHILGLTVGGLSYDMALSVIIGKDGRTYCGSVQKLDVKYGTIEPIKVYIVPSLKPNTCEYKTTMDHELLHVKFLEQAVRDGSKLIEVALKRELRGKTFTASSSSSVSSDAKKFVSSIIEREFNKVSAKLDAQNASIDTKEAYAKTAAICSKKKS